MAQHKLPVCKLKLLEEGKSFAGKQEWAAYLQQVGTCAEHSRSISGPRHVRIATEGALTGSLLAHGFPAAMGIPSASSGHRVSDDACLQTPALQAEIRQ